MKNEIFPINTKVRAAEQRSVKKNPEFFNHEFHGLYEFSCRVLGPTERRDALGIPEGVTLATEGTQEFH